MVSALTVLFLGCWLAGHSGAWGEPSYPKPSISLSPSGGVSLGGDVAVWCRGQHQGMRFVLNKEGRHFPAVDPKGLEAVFPIRNVSREDRGRYSCSYHSRSGSAAASSPSDPVELVVTDPSLPRPSISLSPTGVTAPGANVTIQCQGQPRDVRFFLHKAGDLNPPRHMDPTGDGAEFRIPTVGRQHGGSYGCSYRPRSEPFVSSQPSHPVQLVVAAARPGHQDFTYANIARLALSAMVLLVKGLIPAEAYYSRPREVPLAPLGCPDFTHADIARLALSAMVLLIVGLILAEAHYSRPRGNQPDPAWSGADSHRPGQHGARYHQTSSRNRLVVPRGWGWLGGTEAVNPGAPHCPIMVSALTVLLGCWLAGRSGALGQGSYPKPSISVSPGGVIPVGGNFTIQCWHQRLGVRFVLYKDGDGNHLTYTDSASYGAEFPIPSARREHGGSYTCRSYRTGPTGYSEPSDPVQIIVVDPSLPRPSISLSPTGVTAPGADVTIRCRGQSRDVRFFLHKAGDLNPPRHMDPAGDGAEFRIPTVGRQHGGSYGCSYRPRSEPFVSSQPSHPVQLVVAGGSKSPAPSGLTSPIIAGASAAAAVLLLLLLLLVAFLCFRKTRVRKGAAPRPRSTIPLGMLKAPAQQDPIYSSVDEGKETQTLPQEPDPGTDGLTYAELDCQALHAKPGGPPPAPEPTQPSMYAVISVSQGALQ
ncbi:leukocyte immunoglobulin-like receptor subfamily A member 2 [Lepidochelys kempii]|uniref:leukocyte immunoglobulin-like receptor subfamily A member 2 n=1 Tax=Lepidochelys kempii TaxID=8472 RepID=UPI003C6FA14C